MTITRERMDQMYHSLAKFGGHSATKGEMKLEGVRVGEVREMRLNVLPTTALVSLGVAKDEAEAGEFLMFLTNGAVVGLAGDQNPTNVLSSLVKFGFYIGLAVGEKGANKEAV